jgi:hypothetical protein
MLHDRYPGFGEARSAAVDIGGDLVAEVAVLLRAEPGELRADPTTGPAPASAELSTLCRRILMRNWS